MADSSFRGSRKTTASSQVTVETNSGSAGFATMQADESLGWVVHWLLLLSSLLLIHVHFTSAAALRALSNASEPVCIAPLHLSKASLCHSEIGIPAAIKCRLVWSLKRLRGQPVFRFPSRSSP